MTARKFDNVWPALEPTGADAINMTLRSDLMTAIEHVVESWQLPQAEAAQRLGLNRPHLNDLLRGKISKFSLDALTTIATRTGLTVRMSVKKAAVRRAA